MASASSAKPDGVAIVTNVSATVRARVEEVPALAAKLREVDEFLRRPLAFREEPLPGGAVGGADYEAGLVRLAPGATDNLDVVGEEIMHFHRRAMRFPIVRPVEGPRMIRRGLTQLAGHFDEVAFFPLLEGIGLAPRRQLTDWRPTLTALEASLDEIEAGETLEWRVLLPVTYLQARLIYPDSPNAPGVLALFDRPILERYRTLGQLLCDEVAAAREEGPDQVHTRMERCVRDHLRLPDGAASIDRLPRP